MRKPRFESGRWPPRLHRFPMAGSDETPGMTRRPAVPRFWGRLRTTNARTMTADDVRSGAVRTRSARLEALAPFHRLSAAVVAGPPEAVTVSGGAVLKEAGSLRALQIRRARSRAHGGRNDDLRCGIRVRRRHQRQGGHRERQPDQRDKGATHEVSPDSKPVRSTRVRTGNVKSVHSRWARYDVCSPRTAHSLRMCWT